MAVMSGDIVVGSKPSTRKPEAVIVRNLDNNHDMGARAATPQSVSAPIDAGRRCGAMSQQRSDNGATSMPQKFVHLVGCRDSKAGGQKKR
jgi:hypothetical protein